MKSKHHTSTARWRRHRDTGLLSIYCGPSTVLGTLPMYLTSHANPTHEMLGSYILQMRNTSGKHTQLVNNRGGKIILNLRAPKA